LLLTQEVSEIDRLLIISELEQVLQSLVTDQSINVEFDIEDNGNEKVLTITTTSTLTELVENNRDRARRDNYKRSLLRRQRNLWRILI
jgi:hypothetical protein